MTEEQRSQTGQTGWIGVQEWELILARALSVRDMTLLDWTIATYSILFAAAWCVVYLQTIHSLLVIPLFEDENPPTPSGWPKLSIVVPALNEAQTIRPAVSTLLQQDYPDLEIILINDRSTDDTANIMEGIAREESRVRALNVSDLPDHWLGKVHALHLGARKATGEWILFTDADVHFQQGTLRKAIAQALFAGCDHLVLFPKAIAGSFWLEVTTYAFCLGFLKSTRASEVGKPGSDAFVGAGAFNLVRKAALDKTEGFSWLRMEVVDDVGLGLLLQKSGASSRLLIGLEHVSVAWYTSLRAMFKGLEKNLFSMARYSLARMILAVVAVTAFTLTPVVSVLYLRVPYLWICGVVACLSLLAAALVGKLRLKMRLLPALLVPVGQLYFIPVLLNSGIMCTLRGGINWRGTFYSVTDLRAGQRVKI